MSTAHLTPADGPADPPSSRPRAGVLSGRVFAFSFDPAAGEQRVEVPGLTDVDITPQTVLHWAFYADGAAAALAPHAALAVTVDVRTGDVRGGEGTRLSGIGAVRDRYDVALTADTQFDARWSMPEQWNADTVALEPLQGGTATVEIVLGTDALAAHPNLPPVVTGFVQCVLEEQTASGEPRPVDRVDTRRGTHSGPRFSRGNTIPAVAVPHGFAFVTAATDASDTRWPYRPSIHDDPDGRRLEALQFSHQPSPWIGDRSVLQLMPFAGRPASERSTRRRWITPGSERARPHEYAVELNGGLSASMTAASHTAAFRVTATDPEATVGFVIDQPTDEGLLRWTSPDRFEGWLPEGTEDWGNAPRGYFAGVVRRPRSDAGADATDASRTHGMLDDDGRGRVAGHVSGRGSLEVRVAVSFLSVEQARRSLELEAPEDVTYDDLRSRAAAAWDRVLSRVSIPALPPSQAPFRRLADEEHRARIAAALHRMHLYPNTAAEESGTAAHPRPRFADVYTARLPFGEEMTSAPIVDGELVVNNGYWDTYRTEWPALALLDPALTGRLLDGQLAQYRRGGWMARWSAPGYVDSMVGTSSDQIFADAARWGVRFDRTAAFESGWRNACEPGPDALRGRKGIARGRFTGYIPLEVPEGMSWSIENAVSDAALGRFAAQLAEDAESESDAARFRSFARYFANRALSYRTLFDAESGFFRGRDSAGAFAEDFDPRVWGGDNVETNAWGMSVGIVHDGAGLAELHGGPEGLGRHLDALFAEPETADERFGGAYGTVIHEQREARALRSGMCAISNQPAHHIPFMYAFTDRPWRTGEIVHDLAGRLFAGAHIGQGFPGDEDNGEMSAWWLWAALGLYPLELASGVLRIGSPLFDDIRVQRGDGRSLRIRSRRSSDPAASVLQAAALNGVSLTSADLAVDALLVGTEDAELELVFGTDPATALESGVPARSEVVAWRPDLTAGGGGAIASASVAHADHAFDDGDPAGREGVALSAGEWIGWRFTEPRAVSDLTVTMAAEASSSHLRWEVERQDGGWTPAPVTQESDLPRDRTTPFTLAARVVTSAIRVRAEAEVTIRQLEVFDLG
ncbi:GH92 family glycosyl hydrolase [Microbacterium hydrocarbonoxydans]|uniref:Alpha-1,2-mannosidase, putative n=1 Tax=Microbacterium hydrocarbonoxydans TaxID=273678 RepID=A0A1H4J5A9_9MICO|nr:GH92 family glycosyl hydrolase [Microbacterium hydrocarbonoxydans]SEB41484.1 alpha-1,2-mannosidase, putative [Microbacterium hydrocarbonoxydans]